MLFIRADGTEREVEGYLTLEGLQYVVGGYVEHVQLPDGRHMFLDEEGKMKRKAVNQKATMLFHPAHDYIVGDVLILSDEEYRRLNHPNVHGFKKRS